MTTNFSKIALSLCLSTLCVSSVSADELLSAPKIKNVFNKDLVKNIEHPIEFQGKVEESNINFANSNTNSSNNVFSRRYGTNTPAPAIQLNNTPSEQVRLQAQENSNTANVTALEARLKATEAELRKTKNKLSSVEAEYGDVSVDVNSNVIPSVPKSVMKNLPKYNNDGGSGTDVRVTAGVNQIITISTDQPNRIVTPFNNPQILSSALQGGTGKDCGEVCVKGNVVYISTKKDYPLGLFITDKDNEHTAISLTLVPRRIPPREVNLVLNDSNAITLTGTDDAEVWETSQPFVNSLKKTLLAIALGEVPQGYHLQKIPSKYSLPVCTQNGLKFDFEKGQLMAGVNLNYVIGKITNVSNKPVEFIEASCGGYDVASVAAYPLNLLQPKESTEVYVVQRKNAKVKATTKRRSLLN